jgi:hypothetical protein
MLEHGRRREGAEPQDAGGLSRRAVPELVATVRFEESRDADMVQQARIEERERRHRLEHVRAEMRRRVRILRLLTQPLLANEPLGGRALGTGLLGPTPALGTRDDEQGDETDRGPAKPAVTECDHQLRARDPPDSAHHVSVSPTPGRAVPARHR